MAEFIEPDMNAKALLGKIGAKDARIGVIGLGYVGLPLASAFCRAGFPVVGFDIDPGKIALLRSASSASPCRLDIIFDLKLK